MLFELLLGCAIASVVALAALLSARSALVTARQIQQVTEVRTELRRASLTVARALDRSAALYLFRDPLVAERAAAMPILLDGRRPIAASDRTGPAESSSVLTFIVVDPGVGYRATRDSAGTARCAPLVLEGRATTPKGAVPERFAAVTAAGFQFVARGERPGFECPAWRPVSAFFRWNAQGDLHPQAIDSDKSTEQLYVGVEDIFSLYLDGTGSLRRYSAVDGGNQPVARNLRRFQATKESPGGPFELPTVRITLEGTAGTRRVEERLTIPLAGRDAAPHPLDLLE